MNNANRAVLQVILLTALLFAPSPAGAQGVEPGGHAQADISPHLQAQLAEAGGPVEFLVLLKEQPDIPTLAARAQVLAAVAATASAPEALRAARIGYIYSTLSADAASSQANLRAWLEARGVSYRAFYLVNMIQVSGDETLAAALAAHPDVDRLVPNPSINQTHNLAASAHVLGRSAQQAPSEQQAPTLPYGLTATGAPEVWSQGYRGQGIVVASADTGVDWDHPALLGAYRGGSGETVDHTYNWFDAWANTSFSYCEPVGVPCDQSGHGTHTVGTMLGQEEDAIYGMAPAAQWIGCRNMHSPSGVGTPASYIACFEFFLAPYPQGGDPFVDGRPELAPHIINNSWGCPPREGCDPNSLRQVVETVRAAGLLVVSSAGNAGPGCSTVQDPIAIYDAAFSVGAHDSTGRLALFSSRGPVTVDGSGLLKPDLTAPGVAVRSAYLNDGYTSLSGTSMASPHVAGAAALLWSAAPYLISNPDLTEQVLLKSATPVPDSACLAAAEPVSPNPTYGYGRLDVAAAVALAQRPWHTVVEVTLPDGSPVDGATVYWEDAVTGYRYTATTLFNGIARQGPLLEGRYTLHIETSSGALVIPEVLIGAEETDGAATNEQVAVRYRLEQTILFPMPHLYYFPLMVND